MEFQALGPLELAGGIRDVTPTAPKLHQVIAFLAMRHNRSVRVSELIHKSWGEKLPHNALLHYTGQAW